MRCLPVHLHLHFHFHQLLPSAIFNPAERERERTGAELPSSLACMASSFQDTVVGADTVQIAKHLSPDQKPKPASSRST